MKILVVGSKGFIGSHLVTDLVESGNEVWQCDVVHDYTTENYFVIDTANSNYEDIFRGQQFDSCVNCSGSASVPDSLLHPLSDFYLNTVNVFRLLEAIRKYSPQCKFLNISSAAVYGNPESLPVKENAVLLPVSPYGFHKLQAENICSEFYRFYNIPTCSARIFSAYGNGLKKQLFWDLGQKLKNNSDISLFGTGNESRDFIHIDDIVRAIELIIQKGDFTSACYNLANGEEITVRSAAEKMQMLMGHKHKLYFAGDQRKGDPLNWKADISTIKKLGYQQQVDIDRGLQNYTAWLREEKLA